MEKKSNKLFERIIIVILLIIIVILGIAMYKEKRNACVIAIPDDNSVNQNTVNEETEKNIIVGIEDCLLGSFENNTWYSAEYAWESDFLKDKAFYKNDIEKNPKYYVHSYNKEVTEVNDIIEESVINNSYLFDKNGRIIDDHFRLNVSLAEENVFQITTNYEEDIFKYEITEVKDFKKYEDIVNEVKKDMALTDIDTKISKAIEVDYDGDNEKETLIVVNPKKDELGYATDEDGSCYMVVSVDGDEYKTIFKEIVRKEEIRGVNNQISISNITVCDLNYNGKPELCIKAIIWDIPIYSVLEYDEKTENFEMSLFGEFPW